MAYERRDFQGGAIATTISGDIASGAVSITLAASTGWPDGSNGKFLAVIDRGLSTEEKILVTSRSSNTLTVSTRGYDGTSAVAHTSGAPIEHCTGKVDADEANYTVAQTVGKVTASQDMIVASGANAFARLPVGSTDTVLGVAAGNVAWRAQSTIIHANLGSLTADDHTQYTRKDTLTAKGSLYAASAASTPAAVAVGSNNAFFLADSAQATGVKWGAIPTGAIATSGMFTAGVVDAAALASNAVTTVKILDQNVTTAKIADANVTTVKILDANVTTAKIADSNVTLAKIASEVWTDYTPTLTQSGALTKTVNYARYIKFGRLVIVQMKLTVTSSGSAGSAIIVGLPVTMGHSIDVVVGNGNLFVGAVNYHVFATPNTTTSVVLFRSDQAAGAAFGGDPSVGLLNGDIVRLYCTYEALS